MPMITYGQSQNPSLASIQDVNGKTLLGLTPVASAVNQLTLANAVAGGSPTLSATGSDTNIGFRCDVKGTGEFVIRRAGQNLGFRFLPDNGTGSNGVAYLGDTHYVGASTDQTTVRVQIMAATSRVNFGSGLLMRWFSDANIPYGSADIGFSRNAAGVIEINSGTAGTLRDLTLRNIISNASAGVKIGTGVSEKLGFFGATPVAQQTGGAATAGMVYGATEQSMLNALYSMARTMGLLS